MSALEDVQLASLPPAPGAEPGAPRHVLRVECGVQDPASWLSSNHRSGWQRRHRVGSAWRKAAGWAVRGRLRTVHLQRAHVFALLHFGDAARRDPGNYAPTVKAVVDGLVDGGLLPDDDWRHLDGPDLRLGAPTGRARGVVLSPPMAAVTVVVTDLGPALTVRP